MPDVFELAQVFTADKEGGFSDDKRDPGGVTNYGVSLRFLRSIGHDVDGDGGIDAADIKALTKADAKALFKEHFWDAMRLDGYPPLTAIATYDCAVNAGIGRAAKCLQEALNFYPGEVLAVDGRIGPKTMARLRAVSVSGDCALAMRCAKARRGFYIRLVVNNPEMACFRKGWINRVNDLETYLRHVNADLGGSEGDCRA